MGKPKKAISKTGRADDSSTFISLSSLSVSLMLLLTFSCGVTESHPNATHFESERKKTVTDKRRICRTYDLFAVVITKVRNSSEKSRLVIKLKSSSRRVARSLLRQARASIESHFTSAEWADNESKFKGSTLS